MTAQASPGSTLGSIAQGDRPVLEELVAMNLDSLARGRRDEALKEQDTGQ